MVGVSRGAAVGFFSRDPHRLGAVQGRRSGGGSLFVPIAVDSAPSATLPEVEDGHNHHRRESSRPGSSFRFAAFSKPVSAPFFFFSPRLEHFHYPRPRVSTRRGGRDSVLVRRLQLYPGSFIPPLSFPKRGLAYNTLAQAEIIRRLRSRPATPAGRVEDWPRQPTKRQKKGTKIEPFALDRRHRKMRPCAFALKRRAALGD